jgi:hypothetical protein
VSRHPHVAAVLHQSRPRPHRPNARRARVATAATCTRAHAPAAAAAAAAARRDPARLLRLRQLLSMVMRPTTPASTAAATAVVVAGAGAVRAPAVAAAAVLVPLVLPAAVLGGAQHDELQAALAVRPDARRAALLRGRLNFNQSPSDQASAASKSCACITRRLEAVFLCQQHCSDSELSNQTEVRCVPWHTSRLGARNTCSCYWHTPMIWWAEPHCTFVKGNAPTQDPPHRPSYRPLGVPSPDHPCRTLRPPAWRAPPSPKG